MYDSHLLATGVPSTKVTMSSPITGSSFTVATLGESFCNRITNLLALSSKMKLWFDWAFDGAGNATSDFKSMFLPPPNVIMPFYMSDTEAAVKTAVEALNKPTGDTGLAFWRLCDGTNGTPDLRGRVISGAGAGTSLTQRNNGDIFGSEKVTIASNQVPVQPHFHGIGLRSGGGSIDSGNNDFDFIMRQWTLAGNYHYNTLQGDGSLSGNGNFSNSGNAATTGLIADGESTAPSEGVSVVQPSMAIWFIMRTTRTV